MSMCISPSKFFGKRPTRAQTKVETERVAPGTSSTTRARKAQASVIPLQDSTSAKRQLRSTRQKTSETTSNSSTSSVTLPSSSTQRTLRARKNTTKEVTQSSSKPSTKPLAATPSTTKSESVDSKLVKEKDPVYKHAIVEATSFRRDVDAPGVDEYEFQVETPEGATKKPKKRQMKPKNKMQTLWGMTVKPETKKKLKPLKKVIIQEPENVKRVEKITPPIIVSKEVPVLKKTPPLQERQTNTISYKSLSGAGGISENHKVDNINDVSVEKKNSDKSNKAVNIRHVNFAKGVNADEVKENNPIAKKKNADSSGAKICQTPLKRSVLSVCQDNSPMQNLPSPPFNNNSPIENLGFSSHAISGFLSPIHGKDNTSVQSDNFSSIGKSLRASTPLPACRHPNKPVTLNISLDKTTSSTKSHPAALVSAVSAVEFPQISTTEKISSVVFQHSDDLSSNAGSDFNDSDDLFNPDILKDIQNDGKPSIPARLLEGRKLTTVRGSNPAQLDRFSKWRGGPQLLHPVGTVDSAWRTVPTKKVIFQYEPSIDNCFGFDDGTDAYGFEFVQPTRPVQKTLHTQSKKMPCPQPQTEPCMQAETTTAESQKKSTAELERKSPAKPQTRSSRNNTQCEESACDQSQDDAKSLTDGKIDEMLSSSLRRLRQKKKFRDDSIFETISSNDESEPSFTSQVTNDVEESITSSKQTTSLFEDVEDGGIYKSPFVQPPRRSYAHLRPLKRVFEEQEENEESEEEEERPAKQNKTVYKRTTKKMVQSTLLNQWAKDLSSHFAEVDDMELMTE